MSNNNQLTEWFHWAWRALGNNPKAPTASEIETFLNEYQRCRSKNVNHFIADKDLTYEIRKEFQESLQLPTGSVVVSREKDKDGYYILARLYDLSLLYGCIKINYFKGFRVKYEKHYPLKIG